MNDEEIVGKMKQLVDLVAKHVEGEELPEDVKMLLDTNEVMVCTLRFIYKVCYDCAEGDRISSQQAVLAILEALAYEREAGMFAGVHEEYVQPDSENND